MSMRKERKTDLAAMLKAFLDDVVAKHVLHEGYGMRLHLLKHCHYLLWWGICQLLLYEATAVLIPAEVVHISFDILHHIVTDNLVTSNQNSGAAPHCDCQFSMQTTTEVMHMTFDVLHHIVTVNSIMKMRSHAHSLSSPAPCCDSQLGNRQSEKVVLLIRNQTTIMVSCTTL